MTYEHQAHACQRPDTATASEAHQPTWMPASWCHGASIVQGSRRGRIAPHEDDCSSNAEACQTRCSLPGSSVTSGAFRAIIDGMGRLQRQSWHIGLNAHLLSLEGTYRAAGAHTYIRHLMDHLPGSDPLIRYTAFVGDRSYRPSNPILQTRLSRLPTVHPPVRILWEQFVQPWVLRRREIDLLHAMAFVGPVVSPCPLVVSILDLSFLHHPRAFRPANRLYLRLFTRVSASRARRIIAISEHTKADIIRCLGAAPERVDVVYCGVEERFRPLPDGDVLAFRQEKGLPADFLLSLATLEPRKNLALLLRAYARLPASGGSPPPLILAGAKGWMYESLYSQVEKLGMSDSVRFQGYVHPDELPLWYNAATCFVYPSLYEGFGLPPLEAMACGTPVLSSKAASLPEVVGNAGLLLDPLDERAWAHGLARVLGAPELRRELAERGLNRAGLFSWGRAAEETVQVYHRALAGTAHVQTLP